MDILIVDDEQLILDDVAFEISSLYPNAEISCTTSAKEAQDLIETSDYDVALLDIEMPDIDGLTLARHLIASNPAINIIFITGYTEYALEAHELYCSAFLTKPVGRRKLQDAFKHLRKPLLNLPSNFSEDYYAGADVIGQRIKLCREQRSIPQQELADLMGVTRQTIYRWEQGERIPDILTFLKLARILGVGIDEILELK